MTRSEIEEFWQIVWGYFDAHGRHNLPWRLPEPDGTFDPYKIVVSELMLQQTKVARVWTKYDEFLQKFPTVQALAAAGLGEVLIVWQGLGYNRRAKFLWQTAQKVVNEFGGTFPSTREQLETLPGIGANTAGAVMAYAFNAPVTFIETNIRTVYIHHFFHGQTDIADQAILELVCQTLPKEPRNWYWALMDYGVFLKQSVGNLSRQSKSYAKQSKFEGSLRQIRGQVLRLLAREAYTLPDLADKITDERLPKVLADLEREELIQNQASVYSLFHI